MAERAEIVIVGKDNTGTAFATAKRNLESLQASAVGIAAKLSAIGAVAGTAIAVLEHFNPKGVIDAADGLNKLTQRTGIAVETLSAYQYAAKLADVSNDELTVSLKKLNLNIAAAARGETEQASAFKAIGVSVLDASGKVRSADAVFEDIAERFSSYNDGANKVALANAVGGKSFESLIPLLNGGKQGLIDARGELEKFGGVISGDLAAKSEQFNDNLTKLQVSSNALKVEIAGGLIDSLVNYSTEAVEAAKNGDKLGFALTTFGRVLSGQVAREFAFGKSLEPTKLTEANDRVEKLNGLIVQLQDNLSRDPGNAGMINRLSHFTEKLRAAQADLEATKKDFAGTNTGQFTRTDHDTTRVKERKDAPALAKTGGADDAAALLRKQLEGRVKAIQDGLERERDLFQFSDAKLAELYAHGELSIDAFYDAKNKAQLDSLAVQQKAFTDEIEALKAFQAKAVKPQEKEDAKNKIAEVLGRQSKAFREAGQAAEAAEQQRVRATTEFQRSLKDLDAQLADLSGDKYGAELLRNADRLDQARKLLQQGGVDSGRIEALKGLLQIQADQNRLQESLALLTERQATAEEAYQISAQARGASLLEQEQTIYAMRAKSLEQLEALTRQAEALAAKSDDPRTKLWAEQLGVALTKAREQVDPTLQRINAATDEFADGIARASSDAVLNFKSISSVLDSIGKDLLRLTTQVLITDPLRESAKGALRGITKDFNVGDLLRGRGAGGLQVDTSSAGTANTPSIERDALRKMEASANDTSGALSDMANSTGLVTSVLGALPGAAASPIVASFSATALAANALAEALYKAAAAAAASGGGGSDLLVDFSGAGNTGGINGGSILPSVLRGGAAGGTNELERDMILLVHKGESITPKAYNPAANGDAWQSYADREAANHKQAMPAVAQAPAIVFEDHVGVQLAARQSTKPNGDQELRLIAKHVLAEAARDFSSGSGQLSTALKSRGVNLSGKLPRRA